MTYATAAFYVALVGAGVSAYAGYTQAQTAKKIAHHNADVADIEAADALARGEKAKIEARKRGAMIEGQQRTALSSRGLDLSEGTANDILGQTDFFTQSDVNTAGDNAKKEAWAKQAQVTNFQLQEDGINPGLTLAGSLLSSGSSVSSKWQSYK
ncbi:MAG: hypothetical protein ABI605_16720 [Rhizobacter sp.]